MKRVLERKAASLIDGGAAALLSAFFVGVLRGPVLSALPENDLWWMMPSMLHYTAGQSPGALLQFLLSPAPLMLGQPVPKIYLWLGLTLFGGSTTPLLLISLAIHGLNAVLLYFFSRELELDRRIGLCAALIYLTCFAHFHAYLWPTAFQHLFGVTTILGLVSLYLHADRLGTNHPHAQWWLLTTLAVALFASLQRSTVIAPALILAHILLCSKDATDRAARYGRWLPLFALYAVYPIMALTFVGDPIISTALTRIPLGPGLTAGLLFLGVATGLWLLRALVRGYPRYGHRRWLTRAVPIAAILAVIGAMILRDHRQVLLPYNVLLPMVSALTSWLDPLHKALAIDAVEPYHLIPPQASLLYVLLAVACFAWCWQVVARVRQRSPLLLLVWYALAFVRFQDYSFLLRAPSRYFIYLSPVMAILVCWALAAVVDALGARVRLKPPAGDLLMTGLVVLLCVPNVLAIRLALFRGRLANTYGVYDDLRAAHLIKEDLRARGWSGLAPSAIAVQGALPLPARELWSSAPVDPGAYEALRAVTMDVFGDPAMRNIQVNATPVPAGTRAVYVMSSARIRTGTGDDIDPFTRLFDLGWDRLSQQRNAEALDLFQQAIATRPFLLRYVLAPCGPDDLRWITGGADLRHWTGAIATLHTGWLRHLAPKYQRIAATIHQELSEYLLCLVCAAYLEEQAGHHERSRYWLSQTRLIDNDPERWTAWMKSLPAVSASATLSAFLQNINAPGAIGDPKPWRLDDYGLERFLLRLILRWDIRGRHEMLTTGESLRSQERWPAKPKHLLPHSPAGVTG